MNYGGRKNNKLIKTSQAHKLLSPTYSLFQMRERSVLSHLLLCKPKSPTHFRAHGQRREQGSDTMTSLHIPNLFFNF